MSPVDMMIDANEIYKATVVLLGHGADGYVESVLEPLRLEMERTLKRIKDLEQPNIPLACLGQGTSQIDIHECDIPTEGTIRKSLHDIMSRCIKIITPQNRTD